MPVLTAAAADFEPEVLQAGTPVLVDFWAPWCGPCKNTGAMLEKMADELSGQIRIVKINVDHAPALAARLGVRRIPTLIVYRDGEPVGRATGSLSRRQLLTWLTDVGAISLRV